MTTPNEEALKDLKKLREVAKGSGMSKEQIMNRIKNPNPDVINDPNNPYRKRTK